jgi:PAS domain S-box-containing protein
LRSEDSAYSFTVTTEVEDGGRSLPRELFATILDAAGVGIVVLDSRRQIVLANRAFCDLLGYSESEILGLDVRVVAHAENNDAETGLFDDLLSGKRARYTMDKRCIHKNGSIVWGRVTVTRLRHDSGDLAVAVVEDITEKRGIEQAAEEVRRAHERYALVARATNDVIWDWDAEQGTIVWNDALQTMFGYQPDQIDNRLEWWDSHLNPDDRERVVAGINGIIEQGGSSWTDEYRFERADGTFTEVLDRGYIARSEDGKPIRMIGAMLDVTERKRAERIARFMADASAVLASSLDYTATLTRVAELTVPVLADWCFVDLRIGDHSYERLSVFRDERGRPVRAPNAIGGSTARSDEADLVRDVITSGIPMVLEIPAGIAGDGSESGKKSLEWLRQLGVRSALIAPIAAVPGDRAMGALTLASGRSRRVLGEDDLRVVEDVARRAAMAIEHSRLYDDARKASVAKDEFLAILSHELSTPLTIILGWSGIISRPGVSGEELQRGIESIRASALAQAQLIDDVLDLSRVTTGKVHFEVEPVSIGQLVGDSLTAVRVAASAKRIELIAPDTTIAGTVLGDGNRLRQVIWNLLTNAIKFTKPGGRVSVDLENAPGIVRLVVTDTGQGIAREFVPHVFEPFRQGDSSSTRTHGGLGLGLAIVRYLVEAHGGTVSAFSEGQDRGAQFVVELPLVSSARSSAEAEGSRTDSVRDRQSMTAPDGELKGVRVLFVDDQAEARDLASVVFSTAGAEIAIVSSAKEALETLARTGADIVVTDIGMPDVDGYALIREIRRRDAHDGRHTRVIALTAYRGEQDQQRVEAAGFDAYIKKPMDASTLTATVASVMAATTNE